MPSSRVFFWSLLFCTAAVGWWSLPSQPQTVAGVQSPRPAAPADGVERAPVSPGPTVTPAERPLFSFASPRDAAELTAEQPVPAREVHYVEIDHALVAGKRSPFWERSGRVLLPLPEGGQLVVRVAASEMMAPGRFTSTGEVEGAIGSRVVMAYNQGFLTASIETLDRTFVLRPATERLTQFFEVDPAQVGSCGGGLPPVVDASVLARAAARKQAASLPVTAASVRSENGAAGGEPMPVAGAAEGQAQAEVHVLMAFTQSVKSSLSASARLAAMQSECDAAIGKVNAAFASSEITARVRLVKVVQTQYDESLSAGQSVLDDALTALQKPADGKMDELHGLRDTVGADVVCLIVNRETSGGTIGLGYIMDSPSVVDGSFPAYNEQYAFAAVQYNMVAGTEVVAHELGHVFGCAHARGDPGAGDGGAFSYSYGHRFWGKDGRQYRDIMAYDPGTRIGQFSNPNVLAPAPVSTATGVSLGSADEANAALTIEKTAFELAAYRLQKVETPAGSLINVSTRAYVGTDAQVLIAGFWIDGAQPKRVLVRAAGPALAAYGVPNVLANPKLDVLTGSALVGGNDNWGTQSGGLAAAEVATVSQQVGAFGFAAGSADAATVLTLAPGGYTAIVSGVGSTTGSALVEVYDIDRANNKVVNISTRGYADKGKEMFGGFVVQGDAGTTKRVLIRVLGPTLRNFGVTGEMLDPFLSLHNAAGERLHANDDWSTGTVSGTIGTVPDFEPHVKTYSEKEIHATGKAPSNRREPAMLVDLAPGSYTVIVKPFEYDDPEDPQLPEPGVAIVEVYEIQP